MKKIVLLVTIFCVLGITSVRAQNTGPTEESSLTPTIWQLQKQTTPSDTYMQQYLDLRLAIDSLEIKQICEKFRFYQFNVDSIPDANSVLSSLRGISIKKGWVLDVKYEGTPYGSFVSFYTRRKNEPKLATTVKASFPNPSLPPHIQVEFTTEGIWSAFQLSNSFRYLPKYSHCHYDDYCGIYSLDEVRCRSIALRDSLAGMPEIHNSVTIHDIDHATITAYWWNDWAGLIKETIFVERRGNTVKFHFPGDENPDPRTTRRILVRYNCGVEF